MNPPAADRGYTIDDLPRFSPWPARLLGLEPWSPRRRTHEDNLREYERDKWGPLLDRMVAAPGAVTVEQVDGWAREGVSPTLCSIDGQFELLAPDAAHAKYLDLVESGLVRYGPTSALVELGAGYGSVFLALAQRRAFAHARLVAAEFTGSGMEMLRRLATASGLDVAVGHCDVASADIVDVDLPAGATIFTSYAVPYVPQLGEGFVAALTALRPAVVVHFEPCYEHFDEATTIALMRRRYVEVNDYNRNLLAVLKRAESLGAIRILEERRAVFGSNPFLPASIIAWSPSG